MAARQHGAFTTRQAKAWYSDKEIRTRVRNRHWTVLHRGVFCLSTKQVTLRTRLAAAGLALAAPVVACLHSAAELHGFGVVATDRVHVVAPGRHLATRGWLTLHQLDVTPAEIVEVGGLLATDPARTAIELARTVDRPQALAVLDAALRRGVEPEVMALHCERQAGRRGIVQLRKLLPLADGLAESPMESATRLLCLAAGLPAPELQFPVLDDSGWPVRYLDLAWPSRKVAVEYDGVRAHTGALALHRDRARHNFLVERGWTIIYATADDVLNHPRRLVRRIAHALSRAAA